MMVDYFLIKRQQLDLVSLYSKNKQYPLFNSAGFIAFCIPVAITLISLSFDVISWFYTYGWFTGAISGAIIYYFVAGQQQSQTLSDGATSAQ